jgi:hypothetical protein
MKAKKSPAKKITKTSGVTTRTWVLFGIFLIVSFYTLRVVFAARKITESIVIPTPVTLQIPTKAPTTVHKAVKK